MNAAQSLLEQWFIGYPDWTPDRISHEGPSNMALRIEYALVQDGDPYSSDCMGWSKQFATVWEARKTPGFRYRSKLR